jgi:putative flippase GtrA
MLLAKIIAVGILVWFFVSAKENGGEPFKWAIIGFIGYAITWEALHLLTDSITENKVIASTVPAAVATLGAFFIRQKLIADSKKISE